MSRCTVTLLLHLLSLVATPAVAAPRIVGGHDARLGQFPHQVALRISDQFMCGGSIIAPRWILTAAHCLLFDPDNPSRYTIDAGILRLDDRGQRYQVDTLIAHEGHSLATGLNDVALLRLSTEIAFNENVKAIPFRGPYVGGHQTGVVSGWGDIGTGGESATRLQFLEVPVISNEECKKHVGRDADLIFNSTLCTFGRPGYGTCFGDSGGPLVVDGRLAGVVSWGETQHCAVGYADAFARVSSFAQWISRNIGELGY